MAHEATASAEAVRGRATRRTQVERRSEAEQRLLAAAQEIAARKGAAALTLAEVGERAGYSRGLAAHHFGNKAGLMQALIAYINKNFMDALAAAQPHAPGFETVRGFVAVYLGRKDERWNNSRALLSIMAQSLQDDSDSGRLLGEYNKSVLDYLELHLKLARKAGDLRPGVQPRAAAAVILGALRCILLQHLLPGGELPLRSVRAQLLAVIEGMAAPREAVTAD